MWEIRERGFPLSRIPRHFMPPNFSLFNPSLSPTPSSNQPDLQHCSNAGAPSSLSLFNRRPARLFESQCRGAPSSRTPVSTPLSLSSTLLCLAWSRCSLSHSSIISVLQLSSNASAAVPPLLQRRSPLFNCLWPSTLVCLQRRFPDLAFNLSQNHNFSRFACVPVIRSGCVYLTFQNSTKIG